MQIQTGIRHEDYLHGYIKQIMNQRYRAAEDLRNARRAQITSKSISGVGAQFIDPFLSNQEKANNQNDLGSNFKLSPFRRANFGDSSNSDSASNHENDIEETKQPAGPTGLSPNGGGPDGGDQNRDQNLSYKLKAFKSTPSFVESLTELSFIVL